jgi:hypothetical protein
VDQLEADQATAADLAEIADDLNLGLLDDEHLAKLGRLLLRAFPPSADPPDHAGAWRPGVHDDALRRRRHVLQVLADHGQAQFFDEAARLGDPEDRTISWYLRQARLHAADLAYTGLAPGPLLQLLSRADTRLVRHDDDLLDAFISQLDVLQHELTHQLASRDLWNLGPTGSTPKSEDDISDWIRRQLRLRLTPATIIDREIQVAREHQGIGTRIDLTVTTPTATQPPLSARVMAEAKLVTNKTLETAMQDQLVQRYLLPYGLQCGIYLVYWINPRQRPAGRRKGPAHRNRLMRKLEAQAAETGHGLRIVPYLLDISHR